MNYRKSTDFLLVTSRDCLGDKERCALCLRTTSTNKCMRSEGSTARSVRWRAVVSLNSALESQKEPPVPTRCENVRDSEAFWTK